MVLTILRKSPDMTTATTTAPQTTMVAESKRAYQILHLGYTVAPILFGLDKFFNVMTDWVEFLPTFVTDAVNGSVVMGVVGVIEIAAGIGVWLRPKIFAPVVAAWLGLIIITLILAGGFWDIALRDFGLLLGAVALWRLARAHA
ncbi:MAG: putative transrane protein [Acidimicrobiia bacterium]|nr:putative transrane protein [Acidimicrobiia bacterium]